MELTDLRAFDRDDLVLLKLCIKLNFITKQQLKNLLSQNLGKQLIFILSDSNLLTDNQLNELLRLRSNSLICTQCDNVNIYQKTDDYIFCEKCSQFLRTNQNELFKEENSLQQYGKYKIIQKIGQGSAGYVYKGIHKELERTVALKILQIDEISKEILDRFKREAQAIASLNHPGIIGIYDLGEQHGEYYIAMEYIEGKTLSKIMEHEIPCERKVEIAVKIAQALQHSHDNRIIHRDIKPENIMISKKGEVKVTDFGIARNIDNNIQITQKNMVMGTPLYMSPEQIVGEELDASTDIYSLGVVLYEMLVGIPPYNHSDTTSLLQKILADVPPRPRSIDPEIPKYLENVTLKAIEKDKQKRFSTAMEMADALSQYLHNPRFHEVSPTTIKSKVEENSSTKIKSYDTNKKVNNHAKNNKNLNNNSKNNKNSNNYSNPNITNINSLTKSSITDLATDSENVDSFGIFDILLLLALLSGIIYLIVKLKGNYF